jgi:hypothetical protein
VHPVAGSHPGTRMTTASHARTATSQRREKFPFLTGFSADITLLQSSAI